MSCCFRPPRVTEPPAVAMPVKPQVFATEVYCEADDGTCAPSPPSAPPGPAPAPFEDSEYQQLSRRLMQMLHSMRSVGAHAALELPLLVVCGNQSAGKSSLIEALCGVPLPRSDGTCTRCPLEVRMISAPAAAASHAAASATPSADGDCPGWTCTIKLRREFDQRGQRLVVPEEALFQAGIISRREVERLLRAAQERLLALDAPAAPGAPAAHLSFSAVPPPHSSASGRGHLLPVAHGAVLETNAGGSSHHKQTMSAVDAPRAFPLGSGPPPQALPGAPALVGGARRASPGFSRNVVVLEISSAAVDLVLVDLPGIIHSVEQPSDAHYRDVVMELVRSYVSRELAVIVPVVSCKEDIDTQGILSLAREVDPAGRRTVGVLTKPDQIEPACHRQWLEVLQGRRYPLALGYFMVRNPGQQQLMDGVDGNAARRAEAAFFMSTPPWASMAHQPEGRLGAVALRRSLSRVLVDLTRRALPGLQSEATQRLHAIESQLERLPPPPPDAAGDPRRALLVMADTAAAAVRQQLLAGGTDKAFYQRLLVLSREFKGQVYAAKPRYVVAQGQHQDTAGYAFTCITDGDQEVLCDGHGSAGRGSVLALVPAGPPRVLPAAGVVPPAPGVPLTLEDVRLVIEQHRGLELPGFSPYSAVQALIARAASGWAAAADALLEQATEAIGVLVADAVSETFGRFPEALHLARSGAQNLVQRLRLACQDHIRSLVSMEQSHAFTMNRADFEGTSAEVLQQLRDAYHSRHGITAVAAVAGRGVRAGSSPAGAVGKSSRGSNGSALAPALRRSVSGGGEDSFMGGADGGAGCSATTWLSHDVSDEQILGMMAVSLTYFTVSSRRLVDYVPLHVMHYLVGRLAEQIKSVLVDVLLAGASEGGRGNATGRDGGARWLLREEAGGAARRAELAAQRKLLEDVLSALRT